MKIQKTKKVINLTPHEVKIVREDGKVITSFPSNGVLRLSVSTQVVGQLEVDGKVIPITKSKFGGVDQMPPKKPGTIYIVSLITCQACPDRNDFYIVNESVRDKEGRIIGCKSLARNPYYKLGSKK